MGCPELKAHFVGQTNAFPLSKPEVEVATSTSSKIPCGIGEGEKRVQVPAAVDVKLENGDQSRGTTNYLEEDDADLRLAIAESLRTKNPTTSNWHSSLPGKVMTDKRGEADH